MRELTIDDFARRRGEAFQVQTGAGFVDLVLRQVQELPASGRDGGSFRLEFHGRASPLLHQGTYPFRIGKERVPIFIVPLGQIGEAIRYEAIFF